MRPARDLGNRKPFGIKPKGWLITGTSRSLDRTVSLIENVLSVRDDRTQEEACFRRVCDCIGGKLSRWYHYEGKIRQGGHVFVISLNDVEESTVSAQTAEEVPVFDALGLTSNVLLFRIRLS